MLLTIKNNGRRVVLIITVAAHHRYQFNISESSQQALNTAITLAAVHPAAAGEPPHVTVLAVLRQLASRPAHEICE